MASNEPVLIPTPDQLRGHERDTGEWNTAEWNVAAGWTPPVTEQTPPTKGAVDGWDTAEWDMRAAWASMPSAWPSSETLEAGPSAAPFPQVPLVRPYQFPGPAEPAGPAGIGEPTSSGAWTSDSWFSRGRPSDAPEAQPPFAHDAPGTREAHDVSEASDVYQADASEASGPWDGAAPETGDPLGGTHVWNPSAEPAAVRGRHRVGKQRSSGRGSAVFGVAAAAVLGVGGVASAETHGPASLSLPDLPEASEMPGVGALVAAVTGSGDTAQAAPFDADAGEALRARILDQANQQRGAAVDAKRDAAALKAVKEAAAAKVREEAAAKKKAAAEAAKREAAAEAARLAKSFVKPVASYTLTAGFGETSSLWVSTHTGQDFAAPTGTPVVAIHGGTVTSAGWAGSYGYRIILTLDDGTEIWYCHLSSMTVTSGKVTTGETIGRVGATGNVTGPHLHLEVRPDGGAPIDPMPWLRAHGLNV